MKYLRIISTIVIIAVLAYLPNIIEKDSTINLMVLVFLYIVLASSWNILGGYAGQVSLGHAAFFGLGALAARLLWTGGFNLFLSILAGGLLAVAFAMLIGAPAFRLKGVYFAIGTLALAQILSVTVGNLFPKISALPVADLVTYQLAPRYYLFLGLVIIVVGVAYFLENSSVGLGMMAVKEEEDAAESLGVNAFRHKLLALAISAFFTGLAGGAFAYYHVSYYLQLPFTPVWSLDMLTMVLVGGAGTVFGPIIGAVFFVALKEFLVLNVGEYHLLIFGTLFILIVLFLPGGLVELWEKIQGRLSRKPKQKSEIKITS
jgi:branched-chain amino acid transport system permease protein